ncbi:hypothetical protein IDM40_19750 [Nocardiopsis sp. HNM0947]|uniref:Secreted protein n=1 Tax=Nocardiopsis coralli TaxID=2772213 RepID=A0ABR9PAQ3_9ACTN|nr:hypothetical protein [Nocardiopsis coralli]MBE3000908.1 hypothetical protein [Nocardiopsis coralli]
MKIKVSIILAIICLAGTAFGMFYLWPDRESLNIVHETSENDEIKPEKGENSSRVHDVSPDPDLDVQEILNVSHMPIAVLDDGVAGLNYPEGTVGWAYRVPGGEVDIEITTNSLVAVTHSVPGRWFTNKTREIILKPETGEVLSREDFSSGSNIVPEVASGDVRVFFDDHLKGQLRSSEDDDYAWELDPSSWCSEKSDPEVEAAGDRNGIYLAIDCTGGEGHLVQFDPLTEVISVTGNQ